MKTPTSSKTLRLTFLGLLVLLASPFIVFVGIIILFGILLLVGAVLNALFGVGEFTSVDGDLDWQLNAHFFPYGFLVTCAIVLVVFVIRRARSN